MSCHLCKNHRPVRGAVIIRSCTKASIFLPPGIDSHDSVHVCRWHFHCSTGYIQNQTKYIKNHTISYRISTTCCSIDYFLLLRINTYALITCLWKTYCTTDNFKKHVFVSYRLYTTGLRVISCDSRASMIRALCNRIVNLSSKKQKKNRFQKICLLVQNRICELLLQNRICKLVFWYKTGSTRLVFFVHNRFCKTGLLVHNRFYKTGLLVHNRFYKTGLLVHNRFYKSGPRLVFWYKTGSTRLDLYSWFSYTTGCREPGSSSVGQSRV